MDVKSQLLDAQLEQRATAPTKKSEILMDTSDANQIKYHDGTVVRTVANIAQAQTFTNKTLTSPVINTPTGLTKNDVGLSAVDNTSDSTKNAAVATLTNKTLTSPVINSPTGITKADVGLSAADNTSDLSKNSAAGTLTNKTVDVSLNTFTNIANTNIAAAAAIARTKLASGTNYRLLANSATGVMSENAALTAGGVSYADANGQLATSSGLGYDATNTRLGVGVAAPTVTLDVRGTTGLTWNGASPSVANTNLGAPGTGASLIVQTPSLNSNFNSGLGVDGTFSSPNTTVNVRALGVNSGGGYNSTLNFYTTLNTAQNLALTLDSAMKASFFGAIKTALTTAGPVITDASGNLTSEAALASARGGTGFSTYTSGDIPYASASNVLSKLPVGTAGQVIKSVGGFPAWAAAPVGGVNYFSSNADAEVDVFGWLVSAYTTGATYPAFPGSGASFTAATGNITITRTATSPLRGTGSFVLTKAAASARGDIVEWDFTPDAADKGKVLRYSFDYTTAGTYVDDDIVVAIHDVASNSWIQPTPYKMKGVGTPNTMSGEFQVPANATTMMFAFYVSTASTAAYTLKFDAMSLGPNPLSRGPAISDWVTYTPTFTGFGTPSGVNVYSRRVGDTLQVRGRMTAGTVDGTSATMTLGYNGINGGVTADTTKISTTKQIIGKAGADGNSTTLFDWDVVYGTTTTVYFGIQSSTNPGINVPVAGSTITGTGNVLSFYFELPISGWSSSQIQSSDTDSRVTIAKLSGTATSITNVAPDIIWTSASFDTHGGWDSSKTYTVKVPGYYRIHLWARTASVTLGTTQLVEIYYNVNSAGNTHFGRAIGSGGAANYTVQGDTTVLLKAGDTLKFGAYSDVTTTFDTSWAQIERFAGPAQIAASESVNASYTDTSGQSITSGPWTTVTYNNKLHDSHTAFASGVFTAPTSGKYAIAGQFAFNSNATGVRGSRILKNNTTAYSEVNANATSGVAQLVSSAITLPLLAGDTIRIQAYQSSGGALTISSQESFNNISIDRVGN